MKKYNATQLTANLQQQTELLLDKAIREWQMIPPSKFSKAPAPGAWSAKQCLAHLNSYGNYYLPAIEKAIDDAQKQKVKAASDFTSGWLGNYFTNLMQPASDGTIAKKMRAPKDHTPDNSGNSDEVLAVFTEQQEKLLQLLEASKTVDLNKSKVAISIAKFIRLKLGDVYMFLIAHNQRHVLQAERALHAARAILKENRKMVSPLQMQPQANIIIMS